MHENLLDAAGLPRHAPNVDVDQALAAMGRDKKRTASDGRAAHRFVLLEDIGEPVRNVPVTEQQAREAIGAVVG